MLNKDEFSNIEMLWHKYVNAKVMYRGMDKSNLIFPLSPKNKLYSNYFPEIKVVLDNCDELVQSNPDIVIKEEHFGKLYEAKLSNIVRWSRKDLENNGIYFTSKYQSAVEYADCWKGSQLLQNLKAICNILENPEVAPSKQVVSAIERLRPLLASNYNPQPIVITVKRDTDLFFVQGKLLPVGTLEGFSRMIKNYCNTNKVNFSSIEGLIQQMEKEFEVVVVADLHKDDIVSIEEL